MPEKSKGAVASGPTTERQPAGGGFCCLHSVYIKIGSASSPNPLTPNTDTAWLDCQASPSTHLLHRGANALLAAVALDLETEDLDAALAHCRTLLTELAKVAPSERAAIDRRRQAWLATAGGEV